MHQQLHPPNSERQIEIAFQGERVRGTVRLGDSSEIHVRLDHPPNELSISRHMPYFARGVWPEGFLGKHGEERAEELLIGLFIKQKKGCRKSEFAGYDFEDFGTVRYLAPEPGFPALGRTISEPRPINKSVYVQLENDGPYRLARFFDSGTSQPFLAESAVYLEAVGEYAEAVKSDLSFRHHLRTIRQQLLPGMVRSAALLKKYEISPHQVDFLRDFGRAWRTGEMSLETGEIDHLIQRDYLVRDNDRCAHEIANLQLALDRCAKSMDKFEAAGRIKQAAECRIKIRKLEERINAKRLLITAAGKAVGKNFSQQVERISRLT